jgi:hypothetical protein
MGEARLHVVFGEGPEVLLPRSWPGWVSRSGRCPGTGRSLWGHRLAGRACRRSRGGHRCGQGRLSGVPVR